MKAIHLGDNLSYLGIAFIAGYIVCAAMNNTAAIPWLWSQRAQLVHTQKVVIPKLKAEVHCEHTRGDAAAVVAKKAIVGAVSDTAPIPSPQELPKDCPRPIVPK